MNNSWTYFDAQRWAGEALADSEIDPYSPQFLLQQRHDWDETHLILHNRDLMPADEQAWFKDAIEQLLAHVPAQYIVGKATFYGRPFKVTTDVLIPEPETEELVDWVLSEFDDHPMNVLDLGTGSGVIGTTLALERPRWSVTLSDISAPACDLARENAQQNGARLSVVQSDLFDRLDGKFDLIVTNPPYIDPDDKDEMDQSVIENYPEIALYADEHGLGFYHRLFDQAPEALNAGGQIFGETGHDQENSIQELLKQCQPQAEIAVRHDVAGKMRMIRAWNFTR
ncbi:MAG: peptide chain release factor N(5)-glutamine methyltransferase [Limosilactobacillus sp.]|uniref:peptide chain release factor N(5)-glutamine methyltransferase n=1 Tax=Limosilactobacillus sp. TaxID=2773925 RepID=UPI0027078B81|nr:peptide chain release factor N(5)-glutamine methyltransferase [Limosilactobacillus sp.]